MNEGNCRRRCAAEVPFVPAGVVMFREGRISLIPLFYSTSHFPSYYYQLCELETDNKLRGRRWPAVHLLVANALAVLLSGFPRLLGTMVLPKAKRRYAYSYAQCSHRAKSVAID